MSRSADAIRVLSSQQALSGILQQKLNRPSFFHFLMSDKSASPIKRVKVESASSETLVHVPAPLTSAQAPLTSAQAPLKTPLSPTFKRSITEKLSNMDRWELDALLCGDGVSFCFGESCKRFYPTADTCEFATCDACDRSFCTDCYISMDMDADQPVCVYCRPALPDSNSPVY